MLLPEDRNDGGASAGRNEVLFLVNAYLYTHSIVLVTDRVPKTWVSGFGCAMEKWVIERQS